jgi:quercetin dioxygenase-like cupin family protein
VDCQRLSRGTLFEENAVKVKPITEHAQQPVQMDGATGVKMRMLVGPQDGANVFHMRHFEVAPGGNTPHHQHDYEHEVLILKGEGLVKGEQGDRPCRPGDVVWMPPNEKHQFRNTGDMPFEFICLIPAPQDCTS